MTINVSSWAAAITQGISGINVSFIDPAHIEAGMAFQPVVAGNLTVTVTTPGGTSNAVTLNVERTGGGSGMCTAQNQKPSPSSLCCQGLETNQAGFCEPTDPPGCGVVSAPAARCCHNKAACESNGICLSDPTAYNYMFCALPGPSNPSLCPKGELLQEFSCRVDGCPYSNGNLTTLLACSNDDATNIVKAANPQCGMVNCNP
jgi:hypothetical protein